MTTSLFQKVSTGEFLQELFGQSQNAPPVNYRAFPPKGGSSGAVNTTNYNDLATLNASNGIYFVVNSGGNTDNEITKFNAFFLEFDGVPFSEQRDRISQAPLKPSIQVQTKKSLHCYYPIYGPCSREEWEDMQLRLISYFKSDPTIKNTSRVMRLPGFYHIDSNGNRRKVTITKFERGKTFTVKEMQEAFPAVEKPKSGARYNYSGREPWVPVHKHIVSLAGGASRLNSKGNYDMRCPAHGNDGKEHSKTSLVAFMTDGVPSGVSCHVKCSIEAISEAFQLTGEGTPEKPVVQVRSFSGWRKLGIKKEEPFVMKAPRGTLMMLNSIGGAGKTTFVRNLLLHMAVGRQFGDFYDGGEPSRVFYGSWEHSHAYPDFNEMAQQWNFTEREYELLDENLLIVNSPEDADSVLKLTDEWKNDHGRQWGEFCETVKSGGGVIDPDWLEKYEWRNPDVVCIDTYASAFQPSNENDNSVATRNGQNMKMLAEKTNSVVILLHHIGNLKKDDDRPASQRMRGASGLGDKAATIWNIEPGGNPKNGELDLNLVKNKVGVFGVETTPVQVVGRTIMMLNAPQVISLKEAAVIGIAKGTIKSNADVAAVLNVSPERASAITHDLQDAGRIDRGENNKGKWRVPRPGEGDY